MLQDCNHFFFSRLSSTDPHSISHNSVKLDTSAKIHASHYRVGFMLSTGTANCKSIFCAECPLSQTWSHTMNYSTHVAIIKKKERNIKQVQLAGAAGAKNQLRTILEKLCNDLFAFQCLPGL